MNNNKEKDNYNNNNNNDIKKSKNDIHNNNIYIETPHFHMSQSSPLSSNNNNNYNMENKDIIKNNLNLISSTIPRQVFSNRESYKDYFDLKKKIIVESSTLLHDERRMMNLANALNKKGPKNTNISSRVNYNYNKYIKDGENDKSISNLNEDMIIINNKKLNDDKRILFGNDSRNYNDEFFRGKYPEPDDIDSNLVNVKYTNNILKNSGNMIKIDKKYERKEENNTIEKKSESKNEIEIKPEIKNNDISFNFRTISTFHHNNKYFQPFYNDAHGIKKKLLINDAVFDTLKKYSIFETKNENSQTDSNFIFDSTSPRNLTTRNNVNSLISNSNNNFYTIGSIVSNFNTININMRNNSKNNINNSINSFNRTHTNFSKNCLLSSNSFNKKEKQSYEKPNKRKIISNLLIEKSNLYKRFKQKIQSVDFWFDKKNYMV
jgi:hypothetical protein